MSYLISVSTAIGLSILPVVGLADQAEDINRCIQAARTYAEVSLTRPSATYDGGFFSSDVRWNQAPWTQCTVSNSSVTYLRVGPTTYIIDGFSGEESKADYEAFVRVVERANSQMETWENTLDGQLDRIRGYYMRPVTDRERLRQINVDLLDPIITRILGDREDFARVFFGDDISNAEASVLALRDEQLALRDEQIANMELQLSDLQNQLRAAAIDANDASASIEYMQQEIEFLQRPIDAELANLYEAIDNLAFDDLAEIYEEIIDSPRMNPTIQREIEEDLAARVRSLPASQVAQNLAGYRLLSFLAPENAGYVEKVASYSIAVVEVERRAIDEEITGWIYLSDDLAQHRPKMVSAARNLIENGSCTSAQIADFGGWVASSNRPGMYFMDCGEDRFWFDPVSADTPTQQVPVSQTMAEQICQNAIRREVVGEPRFMILERSYRVAPLLANAVYIQGFTVPTVARGRESYSARCIITSDQTVDLVISRY